MYSPAPIHSLSSHSLDSHYSLLTSLAHIYLAIHALSSLPPVLSNNLSLSLSQPHFLSRNPPVPQHFCLSLFHPLFRFFLPSIVYHLSGQHSFSLSHHFSIHSLQPTISTRSLPLCHMPTISLSLPHAFFFNVAH